jgi:predicted nucleic acid-binding protein
MTTGLVIAETGWLVDRQLGPVAEAALYRSVADGGIDVEQLSEADWRRVAELTEQYSDQHLGGVDAGLIAVAERLDLTTVATLDRRHFGVVRPSHTMTKSADPATCPRGRVVTAVRVGCRREEPDERYG